MWAAETPLPQSLLQASVTRKECRSEGRRVTQERKSNSFCSVSPFGTPRHEGPRTQSGTEPDDSCKGNCYQGKPGEESPVSAAFNTVGEQRPFISLK